VAAIHSIETEPWQGLFIGPRPGLDFDAAFVWSSSPDLAENLSASGISDVRYALPFPNCASTGRVVHREGPLSTPTLHAASYLLESIGLPPPELPDLWRPGSDRVLISPGSGSRRKCWPYFEELVRQVPGIEAIIGPAEEGFSGPCRQLRGLSLTEVADELLNCRLYIGNDSGITHLASYLGCPTIALYGPTDPQVWGPVGRRVEVLWKSSLADISLEEIKSRI
jgi:hypothetical protein